MVAPVVSIDLPSRSEAALGQPYRTARGQAAIDMLSAPAINESELSVRMRISTDAVDRERMSIVQEGILLDLYVGNPVVLFGHGEAGIEIPVAMAESPDGKVVVWRERGDGTYSKGYHKQAVKESMQIFDAVKCGLLRASSVGVTPIEFGSYQDSQGRKIPIVKSCYLNEWSYCAIGVNPQALVKSWSGRVSAGLEPWNEAWNLQCAAAIAILDRNTLNGESILPALRKSLSCLVPGRREPGRLASERGSSTSDRCDGADLSMQKSFTREEVSALNDRDLMYAITKQFEYNFQTRKAFGEEAKKRQEEKDDKPADGPVKANPFAKTQTDAGDAGRNDGGSAGGSGSQGKPTAAPEIAPVDGNNPGGSPSDKANTRQPTGSGMNGPEPNGPQPNNAGSPPQPKAPDGSLVGPGPQKAQSYGGTMDAIDGVPNQMGAPAAPGKQPMTAPTANGGGMAGGLDGQPVEEKQGSVALSAFHTSLSELIANAEASFAPVENPDVVAAIKAEIDRLRDSLSSIEALHGSTYPESQNKLGMQETESTEVMLKAYLARDQRKYAQVAYMQEHLVRIAEGIESGRASGSDVAKSLRRRSGDLARITKEAVAAESGSITKEVHEALAAEHEELKKSYVARGLKLEKLLDRLDSQPAAIIG